MPQNPEEAFRRSFDALLSFALTRGIPFDDAEDLVQETIVSALDKFDPAKGSYFAYCTTALRNRIVNYWRDRHPGIPIEEIDIPDEALPTGLESEEEHARMKNMIDRIRNVLTPEESAFLGALGKVFIDLESRAVSEAARSLGLKPQKGIDVFRRIQRKAKKLFPGIDTDTILLPSPPPAKAAKMRDSELREPQVERPLIVAQEKSVFADSKAMFSLRRPEMPRAHDSLLAIARSAAIEEGVARLMGRISDEQLKRLLSIV